MKKITFLVFLSMILSAASPASVLAASKSIAYQVSCVIPASAQFSASLAQKNPEAVSEPVGTSASSKKNEFGFDSHGTSLRAIASPGLNFYITESKNKTSRTQLLTITAWPAKGNVHAWKYAGFRSENNACFIIALKSGRQLLRIQEKLVFALI